MTSRRAPRRSGAVTDTLGSRRGRHGSAGAASARNPAGAAPGRERAGDPRPGGEETPEIHCRQDSAGRRWARGWRHVGGGASADGPGGGRGAATRARGPSNLLESPRGRAEWAGPAAMLPPVSRFPLVLPPERLALRPFLTLAALKVHGAHLLLRWARVPMRRLRLPSPLFPLRS